MKGEREERRGVGKAGGKEKSEEGEDRERRREESEKEREGKNGRR